MVFSSLPFLALFLPITLFIYYLCPKPCKNGFLLLANLIFYAYGEPIYVLLMLASVFVNFAAAQLLDRSNRPKTKQIVLTFAMILNLSALGWYKYAGLLTDSLRQLPFLSWLPQVQVVLPIGISFYTFQAMSYVIDVYRKDCPASSSPIDFAAYISLFPQLIAGPIVRYSDVASQLQSRTTSVSKFSWGVRQFVIGLAKKVLLANQFALLWNSVSANPHAFGTLAAWMGLIAYTLQIYFDFGGYSDMARGLGAMLGFDFCINFNYPYLASSITDFWHRWHISLSTWFRDYVYIPLGGSRKGTGRTICNLMIVWMLTGFWHGAGWNFLLWGFYYGVLLLIEKSLLQSVLTKMPRFFTWVYTMFFVCIGWVFFASADLSAALNYLQVLFSPTAVSQTIPYWSWLPILAVGTFASTPIAASLWKKWDGSTAAVCVEAILILAAVLLSIASLVSGSYNPFLYFRF